MDTSLHPAAASRSDEPHPAAQMSIIPRPDDIRHSPAGHLMVNWKRIQRPIFNFQIPPRSKS
jgi:hypothetical protein